MTWTEYHDLWDIEHYSAYLADFYDFVSLKTIGKSYEGRTMNVVQVGLFQIPTMHYTVNIFGSKRGRYCFNPPIMGFDA